MASRPKQKDARFQVPPPLLDTTLESGFRITTRELARLHWETFLFRPDGSLALESCRITNNEDAARANHAALAGEFGP